MRISRGFLCALAGVAITIFAWYGPWLWPAWPAIALVEIVFTPQRSFAALTFAARSAIVVGLIALNVAVWGGVANLLVAIVTSGSGKGRGAA